MSGGMVDHCLKACIWIVLCAQTTGMQPIYLVNTTPNWQSSRTDVDTIKDTMLRGETQTDSLTSKLSNS